MESVARGRTRWRRFAVVMVPGVAATAAVGVALAQGALAASFSISGQNFKIAVDELEGSGFVQYGTVNKQHGGKDVAVGVSAFKRAEITGLCQSVVLPIMGGVTLRLTAGDGGRKVEASNIYIDADSLSGDATFRDINIGVAAGDSRKGPGISPGDRTPAGSFAMEADRATLTDVRQNAWATNAGSFKLTGLKLNVAKGAKECF
ncbi:cholesterol esterase [Streptomyces durbertensis]|uniref:Cholesterol esterase n=1 Tax=Streptomyces durbertensis TaxID=2448886 RepID=A0ABR6EFV8_9ACTN|nr:DUF6230 family protein [Streptomyces durbertensis]MBB1243359.1 cholesterol esterase [Streptomyces durbertensis]